MKMRKLFSSLSLMFVLIMLFNSLTFAESAEKKSVQKELIENGNGEYVTYNEPPANWNPLEASDEDLSYYGYPSRPNTPEGIKAWEKVVSGKWVKPKLSSTKKSHSKKNESVKQMNASGFGIWGGYIKRTTTYGVKGSWIVPYVSIEDPQWNGKLAEASQWVGLGGSTPTSSLVQIGTDSIVLTNGTKKYAAWYEIVSTEVNDKSTEITSIPCSSGKMMYGEVYTTFGYDFAGYCDVHFYISNYSLSTSFSVRIRQYTSDMLQSAEWVTERPREVDSNGKVISPILYPITYTNGYKRTSHLNCQYKTSINGSYYTLTPTSDVDKITLYDRYGTGNTLAEPQPIDSTGSFYNNWVKYT